VQLIDPYYVAESSVTIDLVSWLAENKPFGDRSGLMARLQRDLPTYITSSNDFSPLITAMWATSQKGF
jgi:hypothetical protein